MNLLCRALALLPILLVVGCGPARVPPSEALTPGAYASRPWSPDLVSTLNASFTVAARAGPLTPEAATPDALSIRWVIFGDDNGNATVEIAFRARGATVWRQGFPLFWVHPDKAPDHLRVDGARIFAGSIVDLESGTAYELKLELIDPDGGSETRTLLLTTTSEPVEPKDMRIVHVVPETKGDDPGAGTKDDPYSGLVIALAAAKPGDLLLLDGGRYGAGELRLEVSGRSDRPIIIRGAGGDERAIILDGRGGAALLDITGLEHVWLEYLTFRNAEDLIQARNASHIVVRRNRFEIGANRGAVGIEALASSGNRSKGFFITDNNFVGPNTWPRESKRKTDTERIYGIAITGAGHVVAHNRLRGLGDGINNGRSVGLSASSIHNNDISDMTDDCIEADHATTNVRVFRNRLTNCFSGVSAQPSDGGPTYIYRNLILNTLYSPFKLHNHTSGVLLFHNTSVRQGIPFLIQPGRETVNDVITRNNIFVGTDGPALKSTGRMIRTDFDNDGYAWYQGSFARWNGKAYKAAYPSGFGNGPYPRHGPVTLSPTREFVSRLVPPTDPRVRQEPVSNDPRLTAGSGAIDEGVRLSNFNDTYVGDGPDLGCCEFSMPLPHFGPRPGNPTSQNQ